MEKYLTVRNFFGVNSVHKRIKLPLLLKKILRNSEQITVEGSILCASKVKISTKDSTCLKYLSFGSFQPIHFPRLFGLMALTKVNYFSTFTVRYNSIRAGVIARSGQ